MITKVLFVCHGNICRSPLAQGIFEHKISRLKLEKKISADSAAVSNYHTGEKPHAGSIAVAEKNGISIDHQRARQVSIHDNGIFEYIIAMDRQVKGTLLQFYGCQSERVFLMNEFNKSEKKPDVPDPYGQGDEAFDEVFAMLERSIDAFIAHLRARHGV